MFHICVGSETKWDKSFRIHSTSYDIILSQWVLIRLMQSRQVLTWKWGSFIHKGNGPGSWLGKLTKYRGPFYSLCSWQSCIYGSYFWSPLVKLLRLSKVEVTLSANVTFLRCNHKTITLLSGPITKLCKTMNSQETEWKSTKVPASEHIVISI